MADIFLSYSHEDFGLVKPLLEMLQRSGWSVWWDIQLRAGERFRPKIEEMLGLAKCVLAVWTRRSVTSQWVETEANEGYKRGVLFPVLLERVEPPLQFRLLHTLDLVGWDGVSDDEKLGSLMRDLRELIGTPPAEEWDSTANTSTLQTFPENSSERIPTMSSLGVEKIPDSQDFETTPPSSNGDTESTDNQYHFRNLVFDGGGIKVLAYVGALRALTMKGVMAHIRRVGGISAGAICATLVSLRYETDELYDALSSIDFRRFADNSPDLGQLTHRLISEYGLHKGDNFRTWIGDLIARKTGNPYTTFRELSIHEHFGDLHLIGTNVSTGFWEVFSSEQTPNMRIVDAVRISMSVPFLFKAVRHGEDVYVDGGMMMDFPIKLFDRERYLESQLNGRRTEYYERYNYRTAKELVDSGDHRVYNCETLGFRLGSTTKPAFKDGPGRPIRSIDDFPDYIWAMIDLLTELQDSRPLHNDDWQRTIYLDTIGVRATDFDLKEHARRALVDSGYTSTLSYFAWYDNEKEYYTNRTSG